MSLQQLKLALDVTPEEIIREKPAIEEWKKEMGLPVEYGKIDEIGDYYVLSKRIDLPKFISLPFRECDFVLSINPKTQKIHIHSIHYPKNKYDREYVEAMAYRTTNCPYCLDGTKFVPLESFAKFLKPYIPIETNGTQTGGNKKMVLEKWANRVGCGSGELSFDSVIASAGVSSVVGLGIDQIGNRGGRFLTRLLLGGISIGTPLVLSFSPVGNKIPKKIQRHLTLFGVNMLEQATDPSPEEWRQTVADMKRAKNALMGYGPAEALKQLFPKISMRHGGPASGPKQLIQYQQDVSGPIIERPVPAINPNTKSLANIPVRKVIP